MGEGSQSWFPNQQFLWQSPQTDSPNSQFSLGKVDVLSRRHEITGANMVTTDKFSPQEIFAGVPPSMVNQSHEPQGWFYCLPRFRQAFTPVLKESVLKDKRPLCHNESCKGLTLQNDGSGNFQKKFVVFDRSGNKTTLLLGTGIGTYIPSSAPMILDKLRPCKADGHVPGTFSPDYFSRPLFSNELGRDMETDVQSEMHEDTEELNALLYSEDDDDVDDDECSDDEVTSTGHSPSTMTAHKKHNLSTDCDEEVASSLWQPKKRKTCDTDVDDLPALVDTASSANINRCVHHEDDAQSNNIGSTEMDQVFRNKKQRYAKIHETVTVLQSIVPGGKGKNAIVVLDEAINYLKTLRLKAHDLGLTSL